MSPCPPLFKLKDIFVTPTLFETINSITIDPHVGSANRLVPVQSQLYMLLTTLPVPYLTQWSPRSHHQDTQNKQTICF